MEKNEILILYGYDIKEMAIRLAEAAGLADRIGDRAKTIGLKPNLVLAAPAEEGATTHPEIADGLLEYLKAAGFSRFAIIEGSWVGDKTDRAFARCGYKEVAKRHGAKLIDTQRDSHTRHNCAEMDIDLCDSALSVDFMINLPVMKGHCQTRLTCALKNNKGVLPNAEKRRFHSMELHKPIAHLNSVAKNDFILVDAICGDLDFEEGGNPVPTGMLFAALDPVLCDSFAAAQLGYRPEEIGYLPIAEKLGVGSTDLAAANVRTLGSATSQEKTARPGAKVRRLERYINQRSACSACYASVVRALSHLEDKTLAALPGPVCVGQDFQGQGGRLGAGRCTAGFEHCVPGCPPRAVDILDYLRDFC